jgi:hypothetical protein
LELLASEQASATLTAFSTCLVLIWRAACCTFEHLGDETSAQTQLPGRQLDAPGKFASLQPAPGRRYEILEAKEITGLKSRNFDSN